MNTRPNSPPLPTMDFESFRRKLAGLTDPSVRLGVEANAEHKEASGNLTCSLAELFGPDLDRITLWTRIDTALRTASAKVTDGDLDLFVSLALEHVKAEPARASLHEGLRDLLDLFEEKPVEWRQGFVEYVRSHAYPVIVAGRAKWEDRKAELKGGGR